MVPFDNTTFSRWSIGLNVRRLVHFNISKLGPLFHNRFSTFLSSGGIRCFMRALVALGRKRVQLAKI
jgi:hypothetical protein